MRFASMRFVSMALTSAALLVTTQAQAIQNFAPSDISALTESTVESLIETVAIGADHHAYMPAGALGVTGFDLGIDMTAIQVPAEFKDALVAVGASTQGGAPSLIPVPKVSVHKGLPFGVDLGVSYFGLQDYTIIGLDVKYSFLKGSIATPAVAIRGSYNYADLFFMKTRTTTVDLVVSQKIAIFAEPYFGVGYQFFNGDLDTSAAGGSDNLPAGVSTHQSGSQARAYLGVPIKLMILRITPEVTYSFAKVTTYGLKLSVGF